MREQKLPPIPSDRTPYVLELKEVAYKLDTQRQKLLLEVAKNFLPNDEVMPYDAHYLALAEQELRDGTHGSWDNI
ncbi:MAG: hypothetical protein LBE35_11725 [Clostridiales bacterium]|nr:hypothetical protein [Clostridiales bacterium]